MGVGPLTITSADKCKPGRFCVGKVGGDADFAIERVVDTGGNLVFTPLFARTFADVAFMKYFQKVPVIFNVITAAVGDEFTLVLTDDGKVYGCGSNLVPQIGQGLNVEFSNVPAQIKGMGFVDGMAAGLRFVILSGQ